MNIPKVFAALSLVVPLLAAAAEITWDELIDVSDAALREAQRVLIEEHQAGRYERFDITGRNSEIVLSTGGEPGLVGKVVYVGSFSLRSNTWLWGWADKGVPQHLSQPLSIVREVGQSQGFKQLTTRRWQGDTGDAQNMVAIAHWLLDGKGMYRAPDDEGQLLRYWVITDIHPAKP
ncbi:MAG: hypothetical protein KF871_16930 [Hydrogenophaga sp.]|uniref:DUF6882 domain-containing protein n=1 Tax=Hydrogenophaga sp. TaxID=1904254 RepID=UPI001D7D5E3B|nr:DUF6882 domain-containing protein [Hydrogenophaga sp.]MBX3611581.1 hypothetical protein [Hydrogenophaga sp.]